MHDVVDLRSDTLTFPTPAMREAMARAEVGDDVWEEDPDRPPARGAGRPAHRQGGGALRLLGDPGQPGLRARADAPRPGDHPRRGLAHLQLRGRGRRGVRRACRPSPLKTERGFLTPGAGARAHPARATSTSRSTGLVCLENTHNRHGGTCCTPEEIEAVAAAAHARGVPGAPRRRAHLQRRGGARPAGRGLRAPRRLDHLLPLQGPGAPRSAPSCAARASSSRGPGACARCWAAGMRQVGVLAAAGLVALETMVERLAEDHDNAARLAEGRGRAAPGPARPRQGADQHRHLPRGPGRRRRPSSSPAASPARSRSTRSGPAAIRCVTHKDVDADDIDRALEAFREITATW